MLLPIFLDLLKDDFPDVRLNVISKLDQVNQVCNPPPPLPFDATVGSGQPGAPDCHQQTGSSQPGVPSPPPPPPTSANWIKSTRCAFCSPPP